MGQGWHQVPPGLCSVPWGPPSWWAWRPPLFCRDSLPCGLWSFRASLAASAWRPIGIQVVPALTSLRCPSQGASLGPRHVSGWLPGGPWDPEVGRWRKAGGALGGCMERMWGRSPPPPDGPEEGANLRTISGSFRGAVTALSPAIPSHLSGRLISVASANVSAGEHFFGCNCVWNGVCEAPNPSSESEGG